MSDSTDPQRTSAEAVLIHSIILLLKIRDTPYKDIKEVLGHSPLLHKLLHRMLETGVITAYPLNDGLIEKNSVIALVTEE